MLLSRLRDQLAMHFALEEAFGYMDDAINAAPRLSEQAMALRQEHGTLYVDLCKIADAAEEFVFIEPDEEAFRRAVVVPFEDFCRALHRHEEAEQQLILAAFDDDIGAAD